MDIMCHLQNFCILYCHIISLMDIYCPIIGHAFFFYNISLNCLMSRQGEYCLWHEL